MKQILQNLSNGETRLQEVPCPKNIDSHILISTKKTVVSSGTERMLINFGKANYIFKAKQQPDKVKMVLNKINSDGLLATFDAVRSKLDQPIPMGYCNAGVVIESAVDGFKAGDRVVSNGNHAEVVRVPKNLCAKIPDNVDDETAAFTVLGSIGLQGVRLINPTIGECFVVTGLGLVGLICVQILRANGCRVLGIDFDSKKCEKARNFGAEAIDLSKGEDPIVYSKEFSRGRGVDGVLIAASTDSDNVIHQSAEMCRKRGRIVLVGVTGMQLRRDDFFKKELTFQVSASYGPGRYDLNYEQKGNDYPVAFVRWTEQRNFEAVLDMMSSKSLDIKSLISHRYEFEEAMKAYSVIDSPNSLGIVLNYKNKGSGIITETKVRLNHNNSAKINSFKPRVGFIGAGNYASRVLIPAFKNADALLDTIVTSGGISGVHHGIKNKFLTASSEVNDIWSNDAINTVSIVTRHNDHANQVIEALNSGKNVFVEKPLALSLNELNNIDIAYNQANKQDLIKLMVGFNRRFAPHIIKMKSLLSKISAPKSIIITVSAGEISSDHWVQDNQIGGGRVIGEVCHFIDLMRHLVGEKIDHFDAFMIGDFPGQEVRTDKLSVNLSFKDGSIGTIHYFANGGSVFPKERIEVFCDNAVLQLNNYRVLKGYGWKGFSKMKLFKQNKGQQDCAKAFIRAIANGEDSPIPYDEIIESSKISIQISNSLHN